MSFFALSVSICIAFFKVIQKYKIEFPIYEIPL